MARTISLYIDGKRADIGEQSFILWNFAQTDASNPTVIKNSYTQQVTLPATPSNNAIFSFIGRGDRITTLTTFNPLKKAPFAIYDETGSKHQEGYVRVDSATNDEYKVTLYGGLGDFFYNLSYNADGTKKTLADLKYTIKDSINQDVVVTPSTFSLPLTATNIKAYWDRLYAGTDSGAQLINFAPCYNGFPTIANFHTDKAIYRGDTATAKNLYNLSLNVDGYTPKDNCGAILVEMANQHTEWEMQDLRAWLQRPAIRVKNILQALTMAVNTGDVTFRLGTDFFTANNPYYEKAWMTLPFVNPTNTTLFNAKLADLLQGTMTPADFVIGFAKMCGLMFVYSDKKVTLMSRDEYYTGGSAVNLSGRYDKAFSATPFSIESKYLLLKAAKAYGQKAAEYEAKYTKQYGEQKVDTNYEFNSDTEEAIPSQPFAGAADVLESNTNFAQYASLTYARADFNIPYTETCTYKLYKVTGGTEDTKENTAWTHPGYSPMRFASDDSFADFMPRIQLHSADNKSDDGSGVLIFYGGFVGVPYIPSSPQINPFHLSDDPAEAITLIDGEPCWDISLVGSNIVNIERVPSFLRQNPGTIQGGDAQWDFGTPKEYYTQSAPKKPLYQHFWQNYLTDRYDANAVRKTLKVDWTGIQVNAALLRNTYYFENAVWVLESINNYSLTTDDLTECTFVKVMNISNYKSGQTSF